jgi:hypothetical protein
MQRAFDFWLGHWEVHARDGTFLGRNRIEAHFGGTLLQEHWEGASGARGTSLNAFMAGKGMWRQTWVDHEGAFLDLEGGLEGQDMVLRGTSADSVDERITWTPLEDGRVRQLWEQRRGDGNAWTVVFEGFYSRTG